MTETHIAGDSIAIEGRWLRQRCAWCGKTLLDYDLERVAVHGPDRTVAMWPAGAFIRTDGAMSSVDESVDLPDDCCARLDPDVTR